MSGVKVNMAAYLPQQKWLCRKQDDEGNELTCPVSGAEDVWVRVIPPSFETDRKRQSFIQTSYQQEGYTGFDLMLEEIYLTYGGTNMEVDIPVRNPDGTFQWDVDENDIYTVKAETVTFSQEGKETREEFYQKANAIPYDIIQLWFYRVMEVATHWADRFRD